MGELNDYVGRTNVFVTEVKRQRRSWGGKAYGKHSKREGLQRRA